MKKSVVIFVFVFLSSLIFQTSAYASGYDVVPGSCRIESKLTNWCHCDFVGPGNRMSGSVSCGVLSCQHYKDFAQDKNCVFPRPSVTCVFLNPAYSGGCMETFELKEGTSGHAVCDGVLSCLKSVNCIQSYCKATTVRIGWTLNQAINHLK